MSILAADQYSPAFPFKNGHVNTIYSSLFRAAKPIAFERKRIETPDDDFLDLDLIENGSKKVAVLCHGLEGSSASKYILATAELLSKNGYAIAAMNYRFCSGEINRQLITYHSGRTEDLHTVIETLLPNYEEMNLSVDHNALLVDVMKRIATKHKLEVLFHEKPFADINGSGKHNNWSLETDTGINLLSPGKTPMSSLQFLTFFVNTIAAVLDYQDLLCASMMSDSNDHRLGANEAPPTIISVFIGKQLTKVLTDLQQVSKGKLSPEEKTDLKLNVVGKIPEILLDNTDRNRTSPFAFTGNKFEFRAVGAKANCAKPMTVLNTIVAKKLIGFKAAVDSLLEKDAKMKKDDAIFNALRDLIKEISPVLFEGDGYSDAWLQEAKKRGLYHAQNTPEALQAYVDKKNIALFEELSVLSERELNARLNVDLEQYISPQIEGRTLGDLSRNHIIPTGIKYLNTLIENVKGLKEIYGEKYKEHAKEQMLLIERISSHIAEINSGVNKMIEERKESQCIDDCSKVFHLL